MNGIAQEISDDETTHNEVNIPPPPRRPPPPQVPQPLVALALSDEELLQEFISRNGLLERALRHIDRPVTVQAISSHYSLLREAATKADQKMILGVIRHQLNQMEPSTKKNRYIRSLQRIVDEFSEVED